MSTVSQAQQWTATCSCGQDYGDTFFSEESAEDFIREYPECARCDGTEKS